VPDPSDNDRALRDFHQRVDALRASQTPAPSASGATGAAEAAAGGAYRIIAELFGGVLVGLGLGFGVDRLAHTAPWGLIGGVLLGFAVSIWMAKTTADRLTAQAVAGRPPARDLSAQADDEDRG
jgi:ATP synthase protein I